MPHQVALTLAANVRPGEVESLKQLLGTMGDGVANGSVVDLGALEGVHFARFVLLDEAADLRGEPLPAWLVYMSDLDISRERHLAHLVDSAGEGLDRLFGHCAGYPDGAQRTREQRFAYLRAPPGRGAGVLREHGRSHEAPDPSGGGAARPSRGVPRRRGRPAGGQPARDPARCAGPRRRRSVARVGAQAARGSGHRVPAARARTPRRHASAAARTLAVPAPRRSRLPHPAPPARAARPGAARASPVEGVQELAALEDHVVQNPFTALGMVKPGLFRRLTLIGVLYAIDYATRHVFNRGNLAGVKTIHFARWVFLDDKRRVIFASNYDGSLESYMDDFIDKVAWGLNVVFSNGFGYPRVPAGWSPTARGTSSRSRTTCACTRCRRRCGTPRTAGSRAPTSQTTRGFAPACAARPGARRPSVGCRRCEHVPRAARRAGPRRPRLREPHCGVLRPCWDRRRSRRATLARNRRSRAHARRRAPRRGVRSTSR